MFQLQKFVLLRIALVTVIVAAPGLVNAAGTVEVCHYPPGNPENPRDISVSENALQAHLAHGDTEGPCGSAELSCAEGGDCLVFVTSGIYGANLGGLAGADAVCQSHADAAQLGGTYKAWLSDSRTDVIDRISHSAGSYVRVDGEVVAAGLVDLVLFLPDVPIVIDENGDEQANWTVWTGTFAGGGKADYGSQYCGNWTTTVFRALPVMGYSSATDATWSQLPIDINRDCQGLRRLYCFEQ